ncbi:hypothetical protein [Flavobacterium sp. DSR2-3-3]|uniref:hypothetical protein n=1 Tax=Flavobacterium sp. DSR2-3-3 TaxID=2804632 RepID=UPI003CF4BC38
MKSHEIFTTTSRSPSVENENSQSVGSREPSLLQDYIPRENDIFQQRTNSRTPIEYKRF